MSDLLKNPISDAPEQLQITELARSELLKLRGATSNFLRIWVEQGGCSGMIYQAVIDDTASPFDVSVFDDGELKVVTDQQSKPHVAGMQIDYSDDLVEAGFRFINPRASKSCGCGQSFQT
jgi:iron-sulfur cluster assembly accessory protein